MNTKESEPSLRIISEHKGHFPLCFYSGNLYSSCGEYVYKWHDLLKQERISRIKFSLIFRCIAKIRLVARLFRLGISHLVIADSGSSLSIANKDIFFSSAEYAPFQRIGSLSGQHRRPMRFGLEVNNEEFLIAEYFSNPNRKKVQLFEVCGNRPLGVKLTFPEGKIRHIHSIQRDPYSDRLWICTGDYGLENQIAWSDDGFKSLHIIGRGDQSWRTTCILFTKDALFWGMDSPWETPSIIRWDRLSAEHEILQQVSGPIYYGTTNENGWITFSNSVEPGITSNNPYVTLWTSNDSRHFTPVSAFKKDHWNMRYFQFGSLNFPVGIAPSNYIVFSGIAIEKLEDTMVIGQLSPYHNGSDI